MKTVVDSNVLIALWDKTESFSRDAQQALESALDEGALIAPAPVFAELMALPERTGPFLDSFFRNSGISVDWHLSESVWRLAGNAYQSYAKRRRKGAGGQPRRILADFLIGAYAQHHGTRLLTLDQCIYRTAFPDLTVIDF